MIQQINLEKLINDVIPPSDYQHRNGFTNYVIIDALNYNEKLLLEDGLIKRLQAEYTKAEVDTLIVETLAFMKSVKSLPVLYVELNRVPILDMDKIVISASIYEINQDVNMIGIAVSSFEKL